MKSFRSTRGPFSERPYYSNTEIEDICGDELRQQECFPKTPQAIRIDRFIEKRFGLTHDYEDLGSAVLGYTIFGPNGATGIVVSRALDEEGTEVASRRIRSTLAHEVGHIILQQHLFCLPPTAQSLFGSDPDVSTSKILCRESALPNRPKYDGKWWEFQANRAMVSLLLPRSLLAIFLNGQGLLVETGTLGAKTLDADRRTDAEGLVAGTFEVNPVMARLRIEELWPANDERQLRL